ncbi:Sporulation kinase E [Sporotomaculum syntrophicum]|uniref:histidine kinase n=1 Tax=Sporotomaculum syntrophicum TaxID=182264 RepID=A0A9D2WMK0_9FIRM|nr:PAS domain S-box protein [Sporotomaculum syntrophicum]KAF1084165.1 Sporulation kinase E [Sporotomaculum syntrophicum]
MAKDNVSHREKELQEYLLTTHMLCLLIVISSLVLGNKFNVSDQMYPLNNVRLFIVAGLVALYLLIILKTRSISLLDDIHAMSFAKAVYLSFPLLLTIVALLATGDSINNIETILLLPVLIAASITGKTGGLIMSTLCTMGLVFYNTYISSLNIYQAGEENLLFIGMMYIMGWLVGGLTDMESNNRKHLNQSLQSLKEEVASRKKAEEQLRVLSSAVEQSPVMVVIADTSGRIQYVNSSFTSIAGYSLADVAGKGIMEIMGEEKNQLEQLPGSMKSGGEWKGEITGLKKNGEYYYANTHLSSLKDSAGRITHVLGIAEDITAKRQMEQDMAKLDRLNLVGEMAAGIGHEIRNPMTTVRGFLQLLSDKEDCRDYREYFNLMIEELDRSNSIITEFLAMAKDRPVNLKRQNLNGLVEAMIPLLNADAINSEKSIEVDLQAVPDLLLDEKEIRQLLLNLARNGLQAMQPKGRLTIRTFMNRDAETVLAVSDQGCGIAPELLDKIGTPFFTTKDEGTGLGLAVCFSIAARHNASIKIDTSTTGTTFSVVFRQQG